MEIRVRDCTDVSHEAFGRYTDPYESGVVELESKYYGTISVKLSWDEHGQGGLYVDVIEQGGDGVQSLLDKDQEELERELELVPMRPIECEDEDEEVTN